MFGGVIGAPVAGRAAGGRLVTLLPGRDETTRGPEETVGAAGATGAGGGAVGVEAGGGGGVATAGVAGVATGGVAAVSSGTESSAAGLAVLALVVFFAAGFGVSPVASAAFLVRFGLSGVGSFFKPCSSAWRRTRSACASTIVDDGEVTPTPMRLQRSTTSFDAMPSSLASAETRMLLLKPWGSLHQPPGLACSPP